jgi:hypothetical protein
LSIPPDRRRKGDGITIEVGPLLAKVTVEFADPPEHMLDGSP